MVWQGAAPSHALHTHPAHLHNPPNSLTPTAAASLPDSMGSLQQLRVLGLRGNRLAALPAALGGCSLLEELDVRDNQLAALPQELGQLASLKLLLLDNNRCGVWVCVCRQRRRTTGRREQPALGVGAPAGQGFKDATP